MVIDSVALVISYWDRAVQARRSRIKWRLSLDKDLFLLIHPYYDNVGYADLSDFFYVWLRRVR